MIFESKQTINGKPVWAVDTDKLTVTHVTKTGAEEQHSFWHYCVEYYPERLQNLVDNGEIYRYLDELDIKITDAVMEQAEVLMKNNREYQIANEMGDL